MRGAALAATLLALTGAGCAPDVDPRETRLCRIAAVAIFDPLPLRVLGQAAVPASGATAGRVALSLGSSTGEALHRLDCAFAPPTGPSPPDLVAVATEAGPLSEPRLFMLKRFWLDSADSAGADPWADGRGARLPGLPFPLAYALQSLLGALPNAAVYALLAAAYSLVYGLFGRINLAFGEVAALGGGAALVGAALTGAGPPALIVLAACGFAVWTAGLHGAVIERLVMGRLRRSTGQQGLVATIGLALFLREYLRLAGGAVPRYIPSLLSTPLDIARAGVFIVTATPLSLIVCGLAAAASLGVLAILRLTSFGRDWRATSDDPGAAALFGVDPRMLSLKTAVLACGLAGLAGAAVTLISGTVGMVYTTTLGLKALIAAIVGGIGSVPGAFLGGLAIAMMEALWSAYFPIADRDLVIDGLLVAVLVFRPGGLFGHPNLLPRSL